MRIQENLATCFGLTRFLSTNKQLKNWDKIVQKRGCINDWERRNKEQFQNWTKSLFSIGFSQINQINKSIWHFWKVSVPLSIFKRSASIFKTRKTQIKTRNIKCSRYTNNSLMRRKPKGLFVCFDNQNDSLFLDPWVSSRSGCGPMNVLLLLLWRSLLWWLPMIDMFTIITIMHHHLLLLRWVARYTRPTVFLFVSIYLRIYWFTWSHLKKSYMN